MSFSGKSSASEVQHSAKSYLEFGQTNIANLTFSQANQNTLGWRDIIAGIQKWSVWLMLAYQDIKLRYRRSILGPLWITMSMAITVYSMGYLYAHLFHVELQYYYPYLIAGMLAWSLLSCIIIESAEAFTEYEKLIKQIKLPYTLHLHRIVSRNIIIFFHNLIVLIPIFIIYYPSYVINLKTPLFLLGLFVIYFNGVTYGLVLAILGARFRDISQVIKSLIQIIFFITPVMWNPVVLPKDKKLLVYINPFYAYIEVIRAPLLGHLPSLQNLAMIGIMTLIGFCLAVKLFFRYRARIIYWL